jgi:CRISPR locus-related DNA-binding protein
VHLSPVGFDPAERVTEALVNHRADRVYLVSRSKEDSALDTMRQVRKILEKHQHIEVRDAYVNIWDLFSCLEKFREIFEAEKENHLYVNVSTGSKITSIAGMIACMLWGGTPYYANLNYDEGGASVKSERRKVTRIEFLPVYQITMPSPESLKVLQVIDDKAGTISKKELIEALQEIKIIPVYAPSQPRSAPHSRLRAILEPLESHWKFVKVESRGRKSVVTLTEQGKSALRIFGSGKFR